MSIAEHWKTKNDIRWKTIEEIKGLGMKGTDKEGNIYLAGSYQGCFSQTYRQMPAIMYIYLLKMRPCRLDRCKG